MWSLLFIVVLTAPIYHCRIEYKGNDQMESGKIMVRQGKRASGEIPLFIIRPIDNKPKKKIYIHEYQKSSHSYFPEIHTSNGEIYNLDKMIPFLGLDSILKNLRHHYHGHAPALTIKPTENQPTIPKSNDDVAISVNSVQLPAKPMYSHELPSIPAQFHQHPIPEELHVPVYDPLQQHHPVADVESFMPVVSHSAAPSHEEIKYSTINESQPKFPQATVPIHSGHAIVGIGKPHVQSPLSISTSFYQQNNNVHQHTTNHHQSKHEKLPEPHKLKTKPQQQPKPTQSPATPSTPSTLPPQTHINYYFPKEQHIDHVHAANSLKKVSVIPTDYSQYFGPKAQQLYKSHVIKTKYNGPPLPPPSISVPAQQNYNQKFNEQSYHQHQFQQHHHILPEPQAIIIAHPPQSQIYLPGHVQNLVQQPQAQPLTQSHQQPIQQRNEVRPVSEKITENEAFESKKQSTKLKPEKQELTSATPPAIQPRIAQDRMDDFTEEDAVTAPVFQQTNPGCEKQCIKNTVVDDYEPVCGNNGKTYSNKGKLRCAQTCGNDDLQVASNGPCDEMAMHS